MNNIGLALKGVGFFKKPSLIKTDAQIINLLNTNTFLPLISTLRQVIIFDSSMLSP